MQQAFAFTTQAIDQSCKINHRVRRGTAQRLAEELITL